MIVDTAFNQSHLVQSNRQTINGQWVSWSFDRKIVRKHLPLAENWQYEVRNTYMHTIENTNTNEIQIQKGM